MIIRATGKPTKATVRLCKLAVKFAAAKLLSTKMRNNIKIRLRFDEENFLNEKDWWGYCDWLDDNLKPREFVVSIYPKLPADILYRVALHEMAHVYQFATGRMKDYIRIDGINWLGKLHKDTRGDSNSSPWEQEAIKIENKLYKQFKEYLDNTV